MSDQYKIIISVSRHRIAFGYWQRDGGDSVAPMPGGDWPAPLAFYFTDTKVEIGDAAVRAARMGTVNAFDGYFDLLDKNVSYTRLGQPREIRYILLDACEYLFAIFFKKVMFDSVGNLDNNRATMPLTFICESDIKSNERALLTSLFSSSGYNRVKVVEYDKYLDRYVRQTMRDNYDCDNVVVVWTEGYDLSFSLFDMNGTTAVKTELCQGLGVDPRVKFVEDKIWECVLSQNPYLSRDKEKKAIEKAATEFLNSSSPMVNAALTLSDGNQYWYNLDKSMFTYMPHADGATAKDKMLAFLQSNGVTDRSRTLLLLRGVAAENSYFEETLSLGFFTTVKSNQQMREGVMRLIVDDVTPQPPTIPLPNPLPRPESGPIIISDLRKKWKRDVRPDARGKVKEGKTVEALQILNDFLEKLKEVRGTESIIKEVEDEKSKIPPEAPSPQPKPPVILPPAPPDFGRKWHETRATAKALARVGKKKEALAMLNEFVSEAKKYAGTDDLVRMAQELISQLGGSSDEKKAPVDKPTVKPVAKPKPPVKTTPVRIDPSKLKEARDLYQAQGDEKKAQLLTKIIRAKKSADFRKGEVDACRKSKNKEQIRRIVDELSVFVKLCNQAGVETAEYVKLISEYKRI